MIRQIISTFFIFNIIIFFSSTTGAEQVVDVTKSVKNVSKDAKKILHSLEGCSDEALMMIAAPKLSFDDVVGSIYGNNNSNRLVAIDITTFMDCSLRFLPYLAVLLESSKRAVASRAAEAILRILKSAGDIQANPQIIVKKQGSQIFEILKKISQNREIALDMRIVAIKSISLLREMTGLDMILPLKAYRDDNTIVKLAILDYLVIPLKDDSVLQVAELISQEESQFVRGEAIAILCENALSYNVTSLSKDLTKSAVKLLKDEDDPEVIAPLLSCIIRLPYSGRSELTDIINAHPSEVVKKYWKELAK